MDWLTTKYPNIITQSKPFNHTYLNFPIDYYRISLDNRHIKSLSPKFNSTSEQSQEISGVLKKKSVLFTGAHHAREPVSYTMNLYIITTLISEVLLGNPELKEILRTVDVYFIPVVNKDGLYHISNLHYLNPQQDLAMIRKNARPDVKFNKCMIKNQQNNNILFYYGVDLNRNYDSHFGEDNVGSSDDVCDESYRGEYPFSEPETNGLKSIIESIQSYSNDGITIAFNYHAWGNFAIIPPNFLRTDPVAYIQANYPREFSIYKQIWENGNFPKQFILGNGFKTVE